MKKYIIAIFAMLTIFLLPSTVKASDFTGGWVSGRAHDYTTYGNWLYAYGANTNYPNNPEPWYIKWFKSSDGVIIKNTTGVGSAYYFVTYNPVYQTTGNYTPNGYPDWNNSGNLAAGTENPPDISAFHDVTFNSTMNANSPEPLKSIYNAFNWDDGNGARTVYVTGFKNASNFQPLSDHYDLLFTDIDSFYDNLEENDFNLPVQPGDPNYINSDLPMLTFQTNSKSFYKFPNSFDVKGTFTWNYQEHDIYSQNPTDFVMDLTASARLDSGGFLDLSNNENMPLDPTHSAVISSGGASVAVNEYSFAYKEFGKLVYATYGYDKFPLHDNNAQGMADGYCVYIRTRQLSTGKVSAWKIFAFQGGMFEPAGYAEDGSGTVKPLQPNQRDPENSSPLAPYTPDGNTSAQSDPSSSNFQGVDNYDPSTVIFNLKSTMASIGELPAMLAQLIPFLPPWLISLIMVSLGLVVIVGLVKLIVR